MKKIFLICSLLISAIVFGQPVVQRASPANTPDDPNHMSSRMSIIPRYADTIEANTKYTNLDSAGKIIYTRDIKGFWYRQDNPKKWVRVVSDNNLSNNFFFDTTCNCYKIDTSSLMNIINNFSGDSTVSSISVVNDSTIRICYENGTCLNIGIVTNITNITTVGFVTDSSIVVCSGDTIPVCDTIVINKQPTPYIFQNGLNNYNSSHVVEWGNYGNSLVHNTTIHTGNYTVDFGGAPYGVFPYKFYQEQAPISSPGIVSFENKDVLHGSQSTLFGIGYSDSAHTQYGISFSGMFGNRIGFFDASNLSGFGALNILSEQSFYNANNNNSKITGILRHTLDDYNISAVSIFGLPKTSIVAGRISNLTLDTAFIADFNVDGSIAFNKYGSGRFQISDTTYNKPLTVDANGNIRKGYWFGGGGMSNTVTVSSLTITLSTSNYYIFTGSSSTTWNLPASPTINTVYHVKSGGSGTLTISGNGKQIFNSSLVSNIVLLTGDGYKFVWSGTYWYTL